MPDQSTMPGVLAQPTPLKVLAAHKTAAAAIAAVAACWRPLLPQFMAWDTFARRRIDLVGRKDDGDKVIAHEFDFSIRNQVSPGDIEGHKRQGLEPRAGLTNISLSPLA